MQKTVYTCDACEKVIGDKKHITLAFGASAFSGIAVPPSKTIGQWSVHKKLTGTFKHFCNGVCIGRFFSNLMKEVK